MIPGIGTIINSLAVIGVGIVTRIFVKKEIKNFENNLLPLGLLVLTLGIRESLKSPEFLLTLIAVLIGAIIGTYLKIEERIKNFGEYLHNKFEKESSEKNIIKLQVWKYMVMIDMFTLISQTSFKARSTGTSIRLESQHSI